MCPRTHESPRDLQQRAEQIMAMFAQDNPHPRCELNHRSPFELLVAVVLSAQTTDKAVNRCTAPLFKVCASPQQLVALGQRRLFQYISSLGLAPTKARHLVALARQLIDKHDSQVPDTYEELVALPGVGRKTANVILAEIFGAPTLAVDTHVYRVGRRLGLHTAANPVHAEQQLLQVIHWRYLPRAHHWLILHGRYRCKARAPDCGGCMLAPLCPQVGL